MHALLAMSDLDTPLKLKPSFPFLLVSSASCPILGKCSQGLYPGPSWTDTRLAPSTCPGKISRKTWHTRFRHGHQKLKIVLDHCRITVKQYEHLPKKFKMNVTIRFRKINDRPTNLVKSIHQSLQTLFSLMVSYIPQVKLQRNLD